MTGLAASPPRSFALPGWRSVARWLGRPEILLGVCLNSFLAATIIGRSRQPGLLFVALASTALMVVVLTWGRPARHRPGPLTLLGAVIMLAAILGGYAANLPRYDAAFIVANFTSMVMALGMAWLVATRLDLDWRLLLATHALVALPLLAVPILGGDFVWGRLVGDDVHANYLGMIAMVALIGALGMRPAVLRWAVIAAAIAVMVAASSRASMLAAGVAAFTWGACRFMGRKAVPLSQAGARTRRAALALLAAATVLLVLWIFEIRWLLQALDAVFKVNDPYRGLSTGASGRMEIWLAAFALWEAQPLLGVGFKGHAFLLPHNLPAHSAYLGMLADTGVLGMGGYLMLCGAAVAGLWRRRRHPTYRAAAALAASYLVYGIFESRAVGFGNPYSILFLWIALDAARRPLDEPRLHAPLHPHHSLPPGPRPEGSRP